MNTLSTTATRRVGLALVAGAMIVGVSACGGSTASTAPSEAPAKTEAPAQSEAPATSAATESTAPSLEPGSVNLGIAYWDTRTYAFQLMKKGAEAIAAVNPAIEMKATAPDAGDPSKLLPLFQALAQTQTDGIVLQTLAADPLLPAGARGDERRHPDRRDRRPAARRCRRRPVRHQRQQGPRRHAGQGAPQARPGRQDRRDRDRHQRTERPAAHGPRRGDDRGDQGRAHRT